MSNWTSPFLPYPVEYSFSLGSRSNKVSPIQPTSTFPAPSIPSTDFFSNQTRNFSNQTRNFSNQTRNFSSTPSTDFVSNQTRNSLFSVQESSHPSSSSTRAVSSTPFLTLVPTSNTSYSGSRKSSNPRHKPHPTKSVLRSTTFVKERSTNLTPVPVFLPRVSRTISTTHQSQSIFSSKRNERSIACPTFDFSTETGNSQIKNSSFNSRTSNTNSRTSNTNSRTSNTNSRTSNNNQGESSTKSYDHSSRLNRVTSRDKDSRNTSFESARSSTNSCQTSVILPSTRIPVTVEIHHPSVAVFPSPPESRTFVPESRTFVPESLQSHTSPQRSPSFYPITNSHSVSQNTSDASGDRPRKKIRTSQEMTVYSIPGNMSQDNSGFASSGANFASGGANFTSSGANFTSVGGANFTSFTSVGGAKLNGSIPNGCVIPIKELPQNRAIDLETIDEEGLTQRRDGETKVASRSLLSFGHRMNRQRVSHVEFGQPEITTISSDVDSALELKVPTLDRRRSSSIVAFEHFFKSKMADRSRRSSIFSGRGSLVSRLSFSSDRGHDPNELIVTNFNRMTDLRKMLNQQEEKEDFLTTFWSRFYSCEWFEWNLNNAAKFITIIILVLTFIMLIRAVINLISTS